MILSTFIFRSLNFKLCIKLPFSSREPIHPEMVAGGKCHRGGSVFRHGTLRWTYAPRSKQALCLPQRIPDRSDKVSPLCDPDPLLIMDHLQNRPPATPPLRGSAVVRGLARDRGHAEERGIVAREARRPLRLPACDTSQQRHQSLRSASGLNCVGIVSQQSAPISVGELLPLILFFCWSSSAQDQVSIGAISFTLPGESATLLPLLAT